MLNLFCLNSFQSYIGNSLPENVLIKGYFMKIMQFMSHGKISTINFG
jgi:hypothetical protein